MINASSEFRAAVSAGGVLWVPKGTIYFADGSSVDLEGNDFKSSPSFSQHTSSSGSFDVGAAIAGSASFDLNNEGRRYRDRDFTGARVVLSVGAVLESGTEWVRKGTYWVEQPASYEETITLSGDDSMCKFDTDYAGVGTKYPATAATVVADICAHCGVPLLYAGFNGCDAVFKARPEDCTCRDVLSWAAQATCNFAKITPDDRLELRWYDPRAFDEDEDWLDGGAFDPASPYATGDVADGGDFLDYSSGGTWDGGEFNSGKVLHVNRFASATVVTDDVVVTGVRVTASDEARADGTQGRKGETSLVGEEGYVLDVSGNPLIACGQAAEAARRIAALCLGLRFRPFDASCHGDPTVEAGDPAILTDRYQDVHRAYITSCTYRMGAFAALSCSAETPLRRSTSGSSAVTRAIKGAMEAVRTEQTAREAAVQRLNDDLAAASGMYTTSKVESGATTWYVHDKPAMKDSKFVWKVNSAGLGISTDGGKTYQFGLDKWGNAILNTIYAIGLNADYITAGAIRVKSGGKTIFCADVRAGQFWWDSTYSKLTNTGALTVTSGNIGGLTIASNSIYNSKVQLDSNGIRLRDSSVNIGSLTASYFTGNSAQKGVSLCVDNSRYFVTMADANATNGTGLTFRWTYANRAFSYYAANTLNAGCNVDLHNWKLLNAQLHTDNSFFTNGVSVSSGLFALPVQIGAGGVVSRYVPNCYLTFRRGILTACRLPA